MKIHQLILKELKLRKLGASLSILTIVIALTSIIAALHAMRQFDIETQTQLGALTQQTDARVKKMNDQIRKTMKGLGFNVHIYPSQQDLSEVYANGYASNTMPYNYVERLAESPIVTINHLLPQLSRRTLWKEQNREIMLIGVDGQVPISHRDPKKPIMSPVKPGQAVIGSELATQLNLKKDKPSRSMIIPTLLVRSTHNAAISTTSLSGSHSQMYKPCSTFQTKSTPSSLSAAIALQSIASVKSAQNLAKSSQIPKLSKSKAKLSLERKLVIKSKPIPNSLKNNCSKLATPLAKAERTSSPY
ncbi:ABC transporter permease [Rubritalea tangerina]|uniref:ABC transporter permease n=1 Tax=Rubritalea tangerina TaxID=430798 RepID=UPI00360C045B